MCWLRTNTDTLEIALERSQKIKHKSTIQADLAPLGLPQRLCHHRETCPSVPTAICHWRVGSEDVRIHDDYDSAGRKHETVRFAGKRTELERLF